MTPRQLECLNFIKSYRAANGMAPTIREVAGAMGTTGASAYELLGNMQANGLIRKSNKARSIEVIVPEPPTSELYRWAVRNLSVLKARLPGLAASLEPLIGGAK